MNRSKNQRPTQVSKRKTKVGTPRQARSRPLSQLHGGSRPSAAVDQDRQ